MKCKVKQKSKTEKINLSNRVFSRSTDELDEVGIDFVKKCIQIVERRGLHEQGLYRMVGMQSKVNSLVSSHFGKSFFGKVR
jgi:hypothetical protein